MQIVKVRLINSEEGLNGCEKAPNEVLKELRKIEVNEKGKEINYDKLNLEEIHLDLENIEEANYLIFKNSIDIFERNSKSFFIGGDGSISYSILKAFDKVQKNGLLIVFDAHVDCLISGKEPNNRGWLRKLIEEGFNSSRIIIISAREIKQEEMEFLKKNQISIIKMDVLNEDLNGVCDLVMERARNSGGFYISIDIDCAEPACAPGINFPAVGGINSRDLIYFIKRLSLLGNFRGGDIVEINPEKDINNISVKLGAKLLSEMIS